MFEPDQNFRLSDSLREPVGYTQLEELLRRCCASEEVFDTLVRKIASISCYFTYAICHALERDELRFQLGGMLVFAGSLRVWIPRIGPEALHASIVFTLDSKGQIAGVQSCTVSDSLPH